MPTVNANCPVSKQTIHKTELFVKRTMVCSIAALFLLATVLSLYISDMAGTMPMKPDGAGYANDPPRLKFATTIATSLTLTHGYK